MNYARYRKNGLPIGSGITEAACKTVFTQRFKRSGMKWTKVGGHPILQLRTVVLSRIWSITFEAALSAEVLHILPTTPQTNGRRKHATAKNAA